MLRFVVQKSYATNPQQIEALEIEHNNTLDKASVTIIQYFV